MNERINELAIKAGGIWRGGYVDNHAGDGVWTDRKFVVDVDTEQFARLLIKECMEQCENVRNDALVQKKSEFLTNDGKMLYEGVFGGANNCGYAIQQHFGVKE
jgi:hypothetical protein